MNEVVNILTRLKAMHADITGVTAFIYPPPVSRFDQLPVMFAVHDGFSYEPLESDKIMRNHRFVVDALIKPMQQNQVNAAYTSASVQAVSEWIDTITTYYDAHLDMSTTTLSAFTSLAFFMTVENDGVGVIEVEAGSNTPARFWGTHFTLTVPIMITGVDI